MQCHPLPQGIFFNLEETGSPSVRYWRSGTVVLGQPGIGTSLLWTCEQHSCSLIISLTSGFPDMGSLPYRLMITLCCYRHHRVLKPLSHMSRVDTSTGESATILPSLPFPRPPIREEEPKEKWGHINPAKEHKLS